MVVFIAALIFAGGLVAAIAALSDDYPTWIDRLFKRQDR